MGAASSVKPVGGGAAPVSVARALPADKSRRYELGADGENHLGLSRVSLLGTAGPGAGAGAVGDKGKAIEERNDSTSDKSARMASLATTTTMTTMMATTMTTTASTSLLAAEAVETTQKLVVSGEKAQIAKLTDGNPQLLLMQDGFGR